MEIDITKWSNGDKYNKVRANFILVHALVVFYLGFCTPQIWSVLPVPKCPPRQKPITGNSV